LLGEVLSWLDQVTVAKALLHKSSGVLYELLLLLRLGAKPTRHGWLLGNGFIEIVSELFTDHVGHVVELLLNASHSLGKLVPDIGNACCRLLNGSVLVLADNTDGSAIGFPDLEHRVFIVFDIGLALLTLIVVMADAALVPDASNGVHATNIALVIFVNDLGLLLFPLVDVVLKEASEGCSAELTNFIADKRHESFELF